ncbi:MAG: hypothetical protein ACJ76H_02020 [Bacteriovoracaceae bacterium]
MLNFSSISLANTKVKYTAFAVAYVVALMLYWPGLSGVPVWDDITFWFFDPVMRPTFPYAEIWKNFTWPFSVSLQKFFFNLFHTRYWIYHSINFALHAFNSWLVFRLLLLMRLKIGLAFAGFVLFLLHPACVITVAWMVQLKTLVCFTFAIGALIIYLQRGSSRRMIFSYVLYLFSILSKSASLPLPLVMLFFIEKPVFRKQNLAIIPFFLICAFGAYRINYSHLAVTAVKDALETTGKGIPKKAIQERQEEEVQGGEEFTPLSDEPLVKSTERFEPQDVGYRPSQEGQAAVEPTKTLVELSPFAAKRRLFIKTLYYYFWQAYTPMNNAPVKGQNPYPPSVWDYLHLIFLCILILISVRFYFFYFLAAAHIFLLPYFGWIPAPYMNVTWVSDQHLYIALPFFLGAFLTIMGHLKFKWRPLLVALLALFFIIKTREAVPYYKNNTAFYGASIDHNFNNIPLVYNLAMIYISEGKRQEAIDLLELIFSVSKSEVYLRENKFFPYLLHLHGQLKQNEEAK